MTCGHCVSSVKSEIGAIPGVADVGVALDPGALSTVTVTSATRLDARDVAAAIDEAGYELAAS